LGATFEKSRKRFKNIELGSEIIDLIEQMKRPNIEFRPSIDQIINFLFEYCDKKNYSGRIQVVSILKNKKIFNQPFFNDNLSEIKKYL
jgi:hypothetical protein